jgi:hypothetical protein
MQTVWPGYSTRELYLMRSGTLATFCSPFAHNPLVLSVICKIPHFPCPERPSRNSDLFHRATFLPALGLSRKQLKLVSPQNRCHLEKAGRRILALATELSLITFAIAGGGGVASGSNGSALFAVFVTGEDAPLASIVSLPEVLHIAWLSCSKN